MKYDFWVVSLLFLFFCLGCNSSGYRPSKKAIIAAQIQNRIAKKLMEEKSLYACGSGAQMMDEIKMLALSFDYYKSIDIEESRQLLVYVAQVFVDAVNQDARIHPYLYNHPFTAQNLEIRIFLYNPDRSDIPFGKLSVISMIGGVLKYKIEDGQDPLFVSVLSETYEEALKKLEQTDRLAI